MKIDSINSLLDSNFKIESIKAILLDFGGVIYDIAPERTVKTFYKMAAKNSTYKTLSAVNYDTLPYLSDYESGLINSEQFRQKSATTLGIDVCKEIDEAWNETLVDLKPNAIDSIIKMSNYYDLFLLSNTNEIHFNYFAPRCKELFSRFKKLFLSYKMGVHKPDKEIFLKAANEIELNPQNILFIDDSSANIVAAASLNFMALRVDPAENAIMKLSELLHTVKSSSHISMEFSTR
jgi:putative hydrolase of the HAD superfamily